MRILAFLSIFILINCSEPKTPSVPDRAPSILLGNFEDDYEITYTISDSLFTMEEHTIVHISEWNLEEQYFIGQNDSLNEYDPLLYTRIDWMTFEDMEPFMWGFCMTAYNASSADSARTMQAPDRENPKTGCSDFPFSRMKRTTK